MKIDKVKLPEVNKNTILTRKEAEVMIILWNLPDKGGFTNDIIAQYEEGQNPSLGRNLFLLVVSLGESRTQKSADYHGSIESY